MEIVNDQSSSRQDAQKNFKDIFEEQLRREMEDNGKTKNEAVAAALLYAKRRSDEMKTSIAQISTLPRISLNLLKSMLETCRETGDNAAVLSLVGDRLSDPQDFRNCFLCHENESKMEIVSESKSGDKYIPISERIKHEAIDLNIDVSGMRSFLDLLSSYDLTLSLHQLYEKSFLNSPNNLDPVTKLRISLFLLSSSILRDPIHHHMLTGLISFLDSISDVLKLSLIPLFSSSSAAAMIHVISIQQYLIMLSIDNDDDDVIRSMNAALRLLFIYYNACHDDDNDDVFYCPEVCDRLLSSPESRRHQVNAWMADVNHHHHHHHHGGRPLGKWHALPTSSSPSSIISYAFPLPAVLKFHVLELESRISMDNQVRSSLSSSMSLSVLTSFNPYLIINIRRSHIIEDTLTQLLYVNDDDYRKPLRVSFVDEDGIDAGGVKKEYFQLMIKQLLNPAYNMFVSSSWWFTSTCFESNDEYELVGALMGLSIYNGVNLDVRFPSVIYKKLLSSSSLSFEVDLKEVNPDLFNGLSSLLDIDDDDDLAGLDQYFIIERESFGRIDFIPLVPSGASMKVDGTNIRQFVDAYTEYELVTSVAQQFSSFKRGFDKVASSLAIDLLTPKELEIMICGVAKLDFVQLKRVTQYADGYTSSSRVIGYFWSVLFELNEDEKKNFLKFVSGSDRAPVGGLESLVFVISKNGGDSERLPTAHTCFNHLLLPDYATLERTRIKVKKAIGESEGFGLR